LHATYAHDPLVMHVVPAPPPPPKQQSWPLPQSDLPSHAKLIVPLPHVAPQLVEPPLPTQQTLLPVHVALPHVTPMLFEPDPEPDPDPDPEPGLSITEESVPLPCESRAPEASVGFLSLPQANAITHTAAAREMTQRYSMVRGPPRSILRCPRDCM
jgi:hypothetical protein